MSIPMFVAKNGGAMVVRMNDGSEYRCAPTGYGYWVYADAGGGVEPGGEFRFPFPRELHTSYEGHSGVDWPGGNVGSSAVIRAIGPGTISDVYDTNYNTTDMGASGANEPIWRGICVVIDHGVLFGVQTYSLYAHMSSRSVNIGDIVTGGQTIGNVGNTGYSFGNHLHFEVNTPNRRPTDSVPSGYDVTMAWMDAHASGTW